MEDLSFAEATAALNDSVDQSGNGEPVQLQLLGYSDESLADGLLSRDLGLIPALSGNQGDGLLLEKLLRGQTMSCRCSRSRLLSAARSSARSRPGCYGQTSITRVSSALPLLQQPAAGGTSLH